MATEFNFGVVSEFVRQELANAIDQPQRELRARYDLKGSGSELRLDADRLLLASGSEFTLQPLRAVLLEKAARRRLSPKMFDFGRVQQGARGSARQSALVRRGLPQEHTKEFAKLIRHRLPKLRTQVPGDTLRVFGTSKDDLQTAITLLREREPSLPMPTQFTNYR